MQTNEIAMLHVKIDSDPQWGMIFNALEAGNGRMAKQLRKSPAVLRSLVNIAATGHSRALGVIAIPEVARAIRNTPGMQHVFKKTEQVEEPQEPG